ncbi:hypothetical protein KAU33_15780 [Candidatus Dependentiae bacterium]|nr:hypothetical protein [Candidatus Dependentiae bacterium]
MTEKDEYKTTVCSLTGEECDLGDCSDCEESDAHEHEERMNAHCNFMPNELMDRKRIVFKINYHRTIAKFLTGTSIDTIINIFSLPDSTVTPVPYNMSKLIARWPHFVIMKYIMSIGVPNKLVEISNYLLAYYDDEIYLVSPMLTDAEFSRK